MGTSNEQGKPAARKDQKAAEDGDLHGARKGKKKTGTTDNRLETGILTDGTL